MAAEIDFDGASRAWRANKVRKAPLGLRGCSMFAYCCGATKANGEPCKAPPHIWKRSVRSALGLDKEGREWSPCKLHWEQR